MPLNPGTKLGPYEILSPLGAGGMGEVYRAKDARLGREVAVKVLPAAMAENVEARERFEREARAVSKLNHPNICTLFDVGAEGGTNFLVMELLEGETLEQRIKRGALPLDAALKYAEQITDALAKAHRAGIVHRDLKPSNIFLTKQGAKILDFGLAKDRTNLDAGPDSTHSGSPTTVVSKDTAAGTILGTYPYMSPEQLEGKPADARSDLFAFGAVLYEMLTGQRAFAGQSQASVIAAILERDPRSILELMAVCPKTLDRVVRRCLMKDPDERWQSAFDLKMEIEQITNVGQEVEKTSSVKHAGNPWILRILGGLTVLLAVAMGALLVRKDSVRPPIYSAIVPPPGTAFQIEGDMGVPPVLAPDGSAVIFGAGNAIWYRSLRDGSERVLSQAKNEVYPFWSPDSKSIGFFSDGKLKTMEINGGTVKTICDASNPRGGAWGTSGVIVFTPTTRDMIYQVPATGGTPKVVTQLDPKLHTTHRWPVFLPDGQHFLYLAANHIRPQGEENGIYVASLDGKLDKLVVSSPVGAQYAAGKLVFVSEGRLMMQALDTKAFKLTGSPSEIAEGVVVDLGVWHSTFAVSENDTLIYQTGTASGQSQLEWVDRAGKHVAYAGEPGAFFGPKLSKDGKRILMSKGDPGADVWISDESGKRQTRLTFGSMSVSEPVWSPDETHIAYGLGIPGKKFTLNLIAANGSGSPQVIQQTADISPPTDWSPDGRYIVCERFTNGGVRMWLVDPSGKEADRLFGAEGVGASQTVGLQSSGQFSPDGKWMAFVLSTNGPQIYVASFPGGSGLRQISPSGGRWPRWRRDGKELFFVSDRNEMTAVTIREQGEGLEIGQPQALFTYRPALRIFRAGMISYDVSPDGKRFLLNAAADENMRPLTLVTNWSGLAGAK